MGHVRDALGKRLSKKQNALIEDIFLGTYNELDSLKIHKVSKNLYRKWLSDQNFVDELNFRFDSARRQGEMIIARFAPAAATKLISLTDSDKEDTSRKACLDIMAHPGAVTTSQREKSKSDSEKISPEVAGRLLAAMAKESNQ